MRILIFNLFICLLTLSVAKAQSWTVSIPMYQQIIDLPVDVEVTAYCDTMSGQDAEFHLPLPPVSGVSYYVHIDAAIPSTDSFELIHNGISNTLKLGDSMLIIPTATVNCIQFGEPCEVIKLSYAGPSPQVNSSFASLKFMAVGTPTVAGENYPESPCNGWFNQGIGCLFPHYAAIIDMQTGDSCFTTNNTVSAISSNSDVLNFSVNVFPNPVKNLLIIKSNESEKNRLYTLQNYFGIELKRGSILSDLTEIDLSELASGIYFLCIAGTTNEVHRIIKE